MPNINPHLSRSIISNLSANIINRIHTISNNNNDLLTDQFFNDSLINNLQSTPLISDINLFMAYQLIEGKITNCLSRSISLDDTFEIIQSNNGPITRWSYILIFVTINGNINQGKYYIASLIYGHPKYLFNYREIYQRNQNNNPFIM
tara:strand:- start:176 stop:616 length:441 start_codon:yes stop_codon:yes gene_type:complete